MPTQSTTTRLARVDAVRFLCILWVIWRHLTESEALHWTLDLVRFRMPVFVILAIFFLLASQERDPQRTFPQYARQRFLNIYVPFVIWAFVYYFLHALVEVGLEGGDWPRISRGILLHGQAVHLWFVPFIVLAGLAAFPAAQWLLRHTSYARLIGVLFLSGGILLAALVGKETTDHLIDPEFRQHIKDLLWNALTLGPCIPLGIGAFFLHFSTRRAGSPLLSFLGLALFTANFFAGIIWGHHPLTDALAGLGLVFFALSPNQGQISRVLGVWGKYSFGMYLTHLLFVDAVHVMRRHLFHLPPSWWYDLLGLLFAAVGTVGFTLALSRGRVGRWLVPPSHGTLRPENSEAAASVTPGIVR